MKSITLMVLLLATWPWSSVKEYHMTASNSVPAATGIVKAHIDKDNRNTKLEIKVFNLADPSRLTPPANDYIVWIRPKRRRRSETGRYPYGQEPERPIEGGHYVEGL